MIKFVPKLFIIVLIIVSLFVFAGCNIIDELNNENLPNESRVAYIDSNTIEGDKFKLNFQKPHIFSNAENYSVKIDFKITNKEYETQEFKFRRIKLVKESTGSEYLNDNYFKTNLYLDAELTESLKLAFTIPTSTEKDNYKLVFEINNYEITYFLYDMPDELRIDRKISYFINEQLIKTDTVKDNRRLSSLFVHESRDNLLYCNTWYTDKEMKHKFNATTAITSDINLYGYPVSIFKWSTTPSDKYTFLNGVNHVPSNGILIIPETNQGKELCIGLYAIKGISVTAIYIPKTVHTIYGGNFTGIGKATIYYAGTETEWEALFYNKSEIPTTNVVFNTAYEG